MLIIRLRGKMYFCFMAYYIGDLYVLSGLVTSKISPELLFLLKTKNLMFAILTNL